MVAAQAERALVAPLRTAVDHGDVAVRAPRGAEPAATAFFLRAAKQARFHQSVEEPWIDEAAEKSGARAERKVNRLLSGGDT